MNISSLVVNVADLSMIDNIKAKICEIKNCEVVACENDKIVVTIEAKNFDEEIKSYKIIERLQGISTVSMVYSYQDLDEEIEKSNNNKIGEIVRKLDSADSKDVVYHGNPII
ncbi:periplasmic nitrate reductase assembly protein [Campylobacter iguaniorum]|uniref:Chaperone NapD n=1 Tax=Campylobacter iguaniorum TaxID=1244531 RepID=A0A076FGT8_9BACT|nr:chaperone NapD [Campylobacter iguaniorum]AII15034.1 periplasmic nitrate reductase assembly protein [Campylobacter iguaniorum]ALV24861.1 periplasmic nitrate reductase assembly protein [Campylobacter iguaniorum]